MLIDRHLERYNIPLSEMRPEYWVEGVAQRFFGGDGGGGGGGGPDSASRRAQPRLATSRGCGREAEVPSLVPRALGVLSAGRLSARRSSHRATRSQAARWLLAALHWRSPPSLSPNDRSPTSSRAGSAPSSARARTAGPLLG